MDDPLVVVGRVDLSVVVERDVLSVEGVTVLPCVPLCVASLFTPFVDLSVFTLLEDVPRCVVPLVPVVFVLSLTLRPLVPRLIVPFSFRVDTARLDVPLLRLEARFPVTILPFSSRLTTLREVVPVDLLSVDRLLTRESYNPLFVDRTDE